MINSKQKYALTFFEIMILTCCCDFLDKNKNYKSDLDNKKICKLLKKKLNISNNICNFIEKNFNFEGNFYFLRNCVDIECLILITKTKLFIIFCGTQFYLQDIKSLLLDLITDLDIKLLPIDEQNKKILVHKPYYSNLQKDDLIKKIFNLVNKNKNLSIYIGGHSMGAGLSSVLTYLLNKKYPNINLNLVTISSPKAGNKYFNKSIVNNKNIFHIDMINNHECIPLFPFSIFNHNYCHIGNKTWIFYSNNTFDIVKKFNILNMYSIKDHFYLSIITNIYNVLIANNFE